MKKLTGALFLSVSLLLVSGCRSAGETRDGQDASTPSSLDASPAGAVEAAKDTLQHDGSGTPHSGEGPAAATLASAEREAQEACLDKWLKEQKLDPYGHPEGTMYAGGSPLFNEMTGESRDRLDYLYQRQPEAKKACTGAAK